MHKALPDGRHAGARLAAQHIGGDGHFAPAKEAEALFLHNDLEHLHGLAALQLPLREKEHAHAVLPLAGQFDAKGFTSFGKIAVRDLGQDADAVAGLALGVLTGAVLKVFHNGQRVGHDLVAFAAAEIGHGADARSCRAPTRGGTGCRVFSWDVPPPAIKQIKKRRQNRPLAGRFDVFVPSTIPRPGRGVKNGAQTLAKCTVCCPPAARAWRRVTQTRLAILA